MLSFSEKNATVGTACQAHCRETQGTRGQWDGRSPKQSLGTALPLPAVQPQASTPPDLLEPGVVLCRTLLPEQHHKMQGRWLARHLAHTRSSINGSCQQYECLYYSVQHCKSSNAGPLLPYDPRIHKGPRPFTGGGGGSVVPAAGNKY